MFIFPKPTDDVKTRTVSKRDIYDIELGTRVPVTHKVLISMESTHGVTAVLYFFENLICENFLVVDDGYVHSVWG